MKDFEQEINESFKTAKKVENEDGGKWEHLQSLVESKEQFDVKIIEAVKGGCIAYLEDTRAFIPASQLSSSYVEKLEDYANKHITVVVITADPEKKRLVLSHRAIEQEEKEKEKAARLAELKVGDVLDGILYGTAGMLDGIITRMEAELGSKATIVATGGLARFVTPLCAHRIEIDDLLLLKGLLILYRKNS